MLILKCSRCRRSFLPWELNPRARRGASIAVRKLGFISVSYWKYPIVTPSVGIIAFGFALASLACGDGSQSTNAPVDNPTSSLQFVREVIDPSPPSGSSCCLDVCAIGDIDGDGLADVVVGSENSLGAVWYHATDWTRYTIGSGDFTTDGEVADVDGDGDNDFVVSCISRDQIEWWENLGSPFTASGWSLHKIGGNYAHDLEVGDIDGDNDNDVVVFHKASEVVWFQAPNDPRGTWTRRSIASSAGEGLDVGDLDGDGDLDVAASRWWYKNGNAGTSWMKGTITSSWGDDCRDIVADIDNDGSNDVLLSHSEGSGRVSWFEGPGWTEHAVESGSLTGAHSLEVGDFDLDHDLDVFTGEMHTTSTKRVLVYQNFGGGLTWARATIATTGTHNARVGDVTGDLKPDIVGKNYDGSKDVDLWADATYSAVTIESFEAAYTDGEVLLRWVVSSPEGVEWLHVYRSERPDEGYFALNASPLRPELGSEYRDRTVVPGTTYWYRLGAVDSDGEVFSRAVAVAVPRLELANLDAFPNPFRDKSTISFDLPETERVLLTLHDVRGRLLATIVDGVRGQGHDEIEWDGRDNRGNPLPVGVYFLHLRAHRHTLTRKLLIVH